MSLYRTATSANSRLLRIGNPVHKRMHTNHRFLNSGSITAAVIAASLLTANLVGAQVPNPSPADGYTVPRTADGQPDLGGFWSNTTRTPLQRSDGVAGEFYTAEEVAAIEARMLEREFAQTVPGTRADVHYDFTQFGLDRSQATMATGLRTSLIFDPPDGRIPPGLLKVSGSWHSVKRKPG